MPERRAAPPQRLDARRGSWLLDLLPADQCSRGWPQCGSHRMGPRWLAAAVMRRKLWTATQPDLDDGVSSCSRNLKALKPMQTNCVVRRVGGLKALLKPIAVNPRLIQMRNAGMNGSLRMQRSLSVNRRYGSSTASPTTQPMQQHVAVGS